MRVEIVANYLSLEKGMGFDFPEFTVLTGVNGSGKSQLLQAMTATQNAVVEDIEPSSIAHILQEQFLLNDEHPQQGTQLAEDRAGMYAEWRETEGRFPRILKLRQNLGDDYPEIENKLRQSRGSYAEYLWNSGRVDLVKVLHEEESFNRLTRRAEFLEFLQFIPCSPDCLTEQDFYTYWPTHGASSVTLPNRLALMMWDYYLKQFRNDMAGFHAANGLPQAADYLPPDQFENTHGPKPWDLLNSIIDGFGGIKYKSNSPEGMDPFGRFELKLVDKDNPKIEIKFSSLSSGEKTMLALAGILYKGRTGGKFPKLVLLDEVDSSLHPSMVSGLIRVIEDVLIPRGTKVILVTHSPTTVALAPERSLHQMLPSGPDRIRTIERGAAVSLLTEGFATLEDGVLMFNQAARHKVSIFTEGHNEKIIRLALNIFGLSDTIGVVSGIGGISGFRQLRTIRDFFAKLPHENQVAFILDCDVDLKFPPENRTHWIVIQRNGENKLTSDGIENAFAPELFSDFIFTGTDSRGNVRFSFDEKRKGDFAEFIVNRREADDFSWFKDIAEQLITLRDAE